jgi:hypothetical protein
MSQEQQKLLREKLLRLKGEYHQLEEDTKVLKKNLRDKSNRKLDLEESIREVEASFPSSFLVELQEMHPNVSWYPHNRAPDTCYTLLNDEWLLVIYRGFKGTKLLYEAHLESYFGKGTTVTEAMRALHKRIDQGRQQCELFMAELESLKVM